MSNGGQAVATVRTGQRGLVLTTLEEMWRFAQAVQKSGLAPYSFKTSEAIFVALQGGMELGMSPMQSIQNLVVVKGKLGMYAATARALVESDPECEWIQDNMADLSGIAEWTDGIAAVVIAKRRNRPEPVKRVFSVADAKRAGLWGKTGKNTGEPSAWITYPGRMLYARALGFALNDTFPDVVRGIRLVEELQDLPLEKKAAQPLQIGSEVTPDALDKMADELDGESSETDNAQPSETEKQSYEPPSEGLFK